MQFFTCKLKTMNKTCIITGGAKRIGKELCRKLAASGWNIVIHYNQSHQEAKELKAEIVKMGVKAKTFKASFPLENEKQYTKILEEIFSELENNSCKIYFPEDVKVGKSLEDDSIQKSLNQIENDDMILDVGSKTIQNIKSLIDNSSTILWNGPLGYFENPNFSIGSLEIAKYIGNKEGNIYSVIGGGDTVSVINSIKIKNKFNFVSTAGGAFLEYLEGKILPGIRALN